MRTMILFVLSLATPAIAFAGKCEVGEKGGWSLLDEKPDNLEEILANAKPGERTFLIDTDTIEWFRNKDGSYLACVPAKRSYCGQKNYHIQVDGDGWAAPFHYVVNCR
jgi:hypothetical protein